jgi:predicted Zn-dependent protease
MGTFFEKLLAKEKKKPGTLERLFSSHPIVSDRITKVNSLIARFPDRSEYVINTSEFSQVKNRLISITNASRSITGRGAAAESDSKRPTLKRRQPPAPDAGSTDTSSGETSEKPTERPTLRKKTDN